MNRIKSYADSFRKLCGDKAASRISVILNAVHSSDIEAMLPENWRLQKVHGGYVVLDRDRKYYKARSRKQATEATFTCKGERTILGKQKKASLRWEFFFQDDGSIAFDPRPRFYSHSKEGIIVKLLQHWLRADNSQI